MNTSPLSPYDAFQRTPAARPVFPGARIALIAPASPFDPDAFQDGVNWLSLRYEILHRTDIFSRKGYLAGDDERRLTELLHALDDPSIDAILCARGGFGVTRLLPGIERERVKAANKMIIGFSDITALHALWTQARVRSVHAPMATALGRASDLIRQQWISTIENPETPRSRTLQALVSGTARGELTGGNLTVLAALLGTPWQPDLQGKILFIEDVGERPYRTDRVLTSMKQAGLFRDLAGLVVGAFTEGAPGADGVSAEDVIASHFSDAPFPVLCQFPAGHIDENQAIPFGVEAEINGYELRIPASSHPEGELIPESLV